MSEKEFVFPSVLDLHKLYSGGLITQPQQAERLAETLIAIICSDNELNNHRPVKTTDQGDTWLIEAERTKELDKNGAGLITMVLNKNDARIMEFRPEFHFAINSGDKPPLAGA